MFKDLDGSGHQALLDCKAQRAGCFVVMYTGYEPAVHSLKKVKPMVK